MTAQPVYEYRADQELPAIPLEWADSDGALIDFSSGWTLSVRVAAATDPTTVLLTKSGGVAGAAVAPNVTIDWSAAELASLPAAAGGTLYVAHLYARRVADNKDRVFRPGRPISFTLYPAPA